MRRRLHLDDLRTSDASTIQVLYGDALGRPLGQLAPATLLDLLAISELDDLPKPMKRDLAAFAERISRAVADLPDGPTWDEFIAEYGAESPTRVPTTFRLLIDRESTREARSPTSRQGAVDLLSTWAGIEPQEVVLRAKATTPTVRADTAPPTGKRTRKPRKAARRAAPKPEVDPDRQEWIKKVCLERLSGYGEGGLAEPVLVAGVCHRARESYPGLAGNEVLAILRELKKTGQVRQSVGRWRLASRW